MHRRNALESLSLIVAGVVGLPPDTAQGDDRCRAGQADRARVPLKISLTDSEEEPMSAETTFKLTRHTLATSKPFDDLTGELERRAPVAPVSKLDELVTLGLPQDQLRARVASLIGSSGFMVFLKIRHDDLFSRFGRTRASVQYSLGNPLIAKEVTDKAPAICLYAPLRLAVYESPETGETVVSYDSPASLFGSFGIPEAAQVGAMLEQKLRDLVNACL